MTAMSIIISKMIFCLVAALLIGWIFGYLLAKARSKEYFEQKIDALEELCESKKAESKELKTKYGNMEVEIIRLKDQCKEHEESIAEYKEKETKAQDVLEKKIEEIRLECEKEKEVIVSEYKEKETKEQEKVEKKIEEIRSECEKEKEAIVSEHKKDEAKEQEILVQKIEEVRSECKQKEEQEIQKLKAKQKEILDECEKKKDETLNEYKQREEEMLSQLEMIAKKNETLQQKLDECISNVSEKNFDSNTILEQINEISTTLHVKKETLSETVKEEIEDEIQTLKKEIQENPKSGKIANFLQNIIKKIKS